jgi:hypothetical protein
MLMRGRKDQMCMIGICTFVVLASVALRGCFGDKGATLANCQLQHRDDYKVERLDIYKDEVILCMRSKGYEFARSVNDERGKHCWPSDDRGIPVGQVYDDAACYDNPIRRFFE